MNVGELIDHLQGFDRDLNVYVPSIDGKAEIAKTVSLLQHMNLMPGITIPADVSITPWTAEEFDELFGEESTLP